MNVFWTAGLHKVHDDDIFKTELVQDIRSIPDGRVPAYRNKESPELHEASAG